MTSHLESDFDDTSHQKKSSHKKNHSSNHGSSKKPTVPIVGLTPTPEEREEVAYFDDDIHPHSSPRTTREEREKKLILKRKRSVDCEELFYQRLVSKSAQKQKHIEKILEEEYQKPTPNPTLIKILKNKIKQYQKNQEMYQFSPTELQRQLTHVQLQIWRGNGDSEQLKHQKNKIKKRLDQSGAFSRQFQETYGVSAPSYDPQIYKNNDPLISIRHRGKIYSLTNLPRRQNIQYRNSMSLANKSLTDLPCMLRMNFASDQTIFDISNNPLHSLKGAPAYIAGHFFARHLRLDDKKKLKWFPLFVGKNVDLTENFNISIDDIPAYATIKGKVFMSTPQNEVVCYKQIGKKQWIQIPMTTETYKTIIQRHTQKYAKPQFPFKERGQERD